MRRIVSLIATAMAVWLICACTFVVDETEYVVVKRFGNPVQTVVEPGLQGKWPWPVDTVVRLDNRLMVLVNPRPGEPDKEYITLDRESGIGKNVEVTTYTCWRIRGAEAAAESALTFLETMGDRQSAETRLGDAVVSELGAALGQHDFAELVSTDASSRKWTTMTEGILERCRQRVEPYGIEIVDIRIERLNFPVQNRRNVFDRMRAERQRIAARYRSEGEELATGIVAEANKRREEILAHAYRDGERIRGEGDAEAARTYAEAYRQDEEFYAFLRTLQSYERTFDENTVLILSPDSTYLDLLNAKGDQLIPPGPAAQGSGSPEAPTPTGAGSGDDS
jgi:membrane protease subunit HflC